MNILLIDNFDSFVFNSVEEFRRRGCRVEVWRNDITAEHALDLALALPAPRLIVLSPGPGTPADAGCCIPLVRLARGRVPIFGICLGHQAIVEALGGEVGSAGEIVHGKASALRHDETGLFAGLPNPLQVARYHSLVATRMPHGLTTQATCGDLVMAAASETDRLVGVQFHPESILTTEGGQLLDNVLAWASQ